MKGRTEKAVRGSRARKKGSAKGLYTLEVSLISGPVTDEFAKRNPVISRTIQIRGVQTLERLHEAIFCAFDREDEHMYEFQIGGKGPMDPKSERYTCPGPMDDLFSEVNAADDLTRTTLESLGLRVGLVFGYWFDFGDDWWHQVKVTAIDERVPVGKWPRVIDRVGESPPQYMDWDEEVDE